MSSFLLTTYKSYSETKTNTEEKYKIKIEKQRRLRCAEQIRLRWRSRLGNRHWKGFPQKQKHSLHFLWWIHNIHTRREVDTMYRMSLVSSRRVLRYWNSHVCLWILHINISFEYFVWFSSRYPFLYLNPFCTFGAFFKIKKRINWNSKWKKDVHNVRRIRKFMF